MALSEAKIKANKKWDIANKEKKRYIVKKSTTKNFISNLATSEDIKEIETLIKTRKEILK